MSKFPIHQDITQAATLPAEFYRSPSVFDTVKEKIFARSWIWVEDKTIFNEEQNIFPFTFLKGVLNEPLVFTKDQQGKTEEVHSPQTFFFNDSDMYEHMSTYVV